MSIQGSAPRLAALLAAALGTTTFSDGAVADEQPTSVAQPCLNQYSVKRTKALNDSAILFVTRDGQNYVNQLSRQCPSMGRNSLLNYAVANSEYCSGASFAVLWQTGPNSYVPAFVCRLGMFVPVSEDEVADIMAMTEPTRRQRRRSERDMVETESAELPDAGEKTTPEASKSEQPAP